MVPGAPRTRTAAHQNIKSSGRAGRAGDPARAHLAAPRAWRPGHRPVRADRGARRGQERATPRTRRALAEGRGGWVVAEGRGKVLGPDSKVGRRRPGSFFCSKIGPKSGVRRALSEHIFDRYLDIGSPVMSRGIRIAQLDSNRPRFWPGYVGEEFSERGRRNRPVNY